MRRPSWTPSIVPNVDDHNVYLVMDDLGGWAGSGAKPTSRRPSSKPSFSICWQANIKTRFAWVAFNTAEQWSQDVSCPRNHGGS
jgi:hypothetical protein